MLQRSAGNGATASLMSGNNGARPSGRGFAVSQPGDMLERMADSQANRVLANGGPSLPSGNSLAAGSSSDGQPLDPASRRYFGTGFGSDLSGVKLHTGPRAAASALVLGARAFTRGTEISFAEGEYAPSTRTGQQLLAHELAHAVQFSRGEIGPSQIMRQPQDPKVQTGPKDPSLPPVSLPGGGITLFPGPFKRNVLGSPIPLPGSLRLTNAFSAGTGPTYVLDLSPKLLVGTILGSLDLSSGPLPGTPPGKEKDPANQSRISLLTPVISVDPATGKIRGSAVLSIDPDYPKAFKGPTLVDVTFESTDIGSFSGQLSYGPLHADMTLKLHYDTARLETALKPAFAPQGGFRGFGNEFESILRAAVPGVDLSGPGPALQSLLSELQGGRIDGEIFAKRTLELIGKSIPAGTNLESVKKAIKQFATEITHPGFTLQGGYRLGGLPLGHFSMNAPTTVPLDRPLLEAPSDYPLTSSAYGVILAPPGAIARTTVPAFGYTTTSFGEKSGYKFTGALLPSMDLEAMGAGKPFLNQFPVYAYAEGTYVRRVSKDLDLGLRVTVQIATPEVFGGQTPPSTDPVTRYNEMIKQYKDASTPASGDSKGATPNVGVTFFGRF